MDLNILKSFARDARQELLKNVSFKIEYVLKEGSLSRRENSKAVNELEKQINDFGKEKVIEEVAYTWFNRFTALQYMDRNGFNDVQIILPLIGNTRPQILSDAIGGKFDNNFISDNTQIIVSALLEGRSTSSDPEKEAYRLLIVAVCNKLHAIMPFLFERISDYTELLMPDDLLSKSSILAKIRDIMTEENCKDVEVIGWLYQFYISEKKDEIFSGFKKNKKVEAKDIPAATQLFTPHWIVKYLVENSLGRIWMLNHPKSSLINNMEFYVEPKEKERNYLKIISPEEIKICDPACGSGHILTYSFDLLYKIYKEEGFDEESIPSLILKNNLYGIELDQRAGGLSALSLIMKAREKQKKFFNQKIQPNICVLENIEFETNEINEYMNELGENIFTIPLQETLKQFNESENFGSLIQPHLEDGKEIFETIKNKNLSSNIFLNSTHNRVVKVLTQSSYLSKKYHIVIANPPYMGSKGMNVRLSEFAKQYYPDSKSDLFAMFMERALKMNIKNGIMAMVNMQSWMFLSTYEKLRIKLLSNSTLLNMAHIGTRGFDTIGGEIVATTAFLIHNNYSKDYKGEFLRLVDGRSEEQKSEMTKTVIKNRSCSWYFRISLDEFKQIPGNTFAYWLSKNIRSCFKNFPLVNKNASALCGMTTGENARFVRYWYEVETNKLGLGMKSSEEAIISKKKWFPYAKGGTFRKWYGNAENVVNWENDGKEIIESGRASPRAKQKYFKPSVSWTFISIANFGVRKQPYGFIFDMSGCSLFPDNLKQLDIYTALLCAKTSFIFLKAISSKSIQVNNIGSIPIPFKENFIVSELVEKSVRISQKDWDSFENSWDFKFNPLIKHKNNCQSLQETYSSLRNTWKEMTDELTNLEIENNKIFINAYKLEDEIKPEIPISEITLTCNPVYRFGEKLTETDQEKKLCTETIKEFISYSVGCMFGRYSLDKPGLIISNKGGTLEDFLKRIPNPSFIPDDDNIIPIMELDWFEDDINARFRKFLRITFGDKNFDENIRFIESSIGKDIRKYFLNDFYKDHIKNYKKRPIYWMFSSPNGSFNALIYLHRYQRDTVSILLDKYLREFLLKLRAEKNTLERLESSSNSDSGEKSRAMKKIQKINSTLNELMKWEKEVIFPLASQRLELDLDDGVKVNYPKLPNALKKISGVS